MILETIITAMRARCQTLGTNIAGAAEFKHLEEAANLPLPCAFVIHLDDNPEKSMAQNAVRQKMTESFAVIVAISNAVDEKGQASATSLHAMRAEVWKALLGWSPTADHNGIEYEGGSLLKVDRARLWYQFEFGADMEIGPSDAYEEAHFLTLPHLDSIKVNIDGISPQAQPLPGPDGRIEQVAVIPKTGVLP